jgi:hypothetical protein
VVDTVACVVDRAFLPGPASDIAKIGLLAGSIIAAVLGSLVLVTGSQGVARSPIRD